MRFELVRNNISDFPINISRPKVLSYNIGECDMHIHDEVEILVGIGGQLEVKTEHESVMLFKGDAVVINRRVPHATRSCVPYTGDILFQFRPEKLPGHESEYMNRYLSVLMTSEKREMVHISSETETAKKISEYLTAICDEREKTEKSFANFIFGYTELLLGVLYRNNILENIRQNYDTHELKKIWRVIEYIDKNYSKTITLEALCGILNMNKNYFCRVFKKATGTTPTEYINFVRVWKAENLLTTTKQSVLEISMEVGFSSVSYFNRIFKKLKNTNPTTYRNVLYAKNKIV